MSTISSSVAIDRLLTSIFGDYVEQGLGRFRLHAVSAGWKYIFAFLYEF